MDRSTILKRQMLRLKRTYRVRKHLRGTADKPRLCVVKTNMHIEAQIIDDEAGITIVGVSTRAKELRGTTAGRKNKAAAAKLGEQIAVLAKEKNVKSVIFDRGYFTYHGVLAALADAARANGLKF